VVSKNPTRRSGAPSPKQRARSARDKQERRAAILAAAEELFEARGLAFTMADAAEGAGLAKGTLYLYFTTKEAMLLALLEEKLFAWFDAMDARLDAAAARRGAPALAALLSSSVAEEPTLVRLLAVLQTVLEHNIAPEEVLPFKAELARRTAATGARLETRGLPKGEGERLLLRFHALIIGLHQMAEPAPAMREVLAREELAALRIDFQEELSSALAALVRGITTR
jgi:AcrR family transcriptional regulator